MRGCKCFVTHTDRVQAALPWLQSVRLSQLCWMLIAEEQVYDQSMIAQPQQISLSCISWSYRLPSHACLCARQETEKRLKDIVTGKKAAVLANANGVNKKSQLGRQSQRLVFTVRTCSFQN